MAKTKAHAKRKEDSVSKSECIKTMSYYTQHYQDDENDQADAGKDNRNNALSGTIEQNMELHDLVVVQKEHENLMMHNQMKNEEVVACDALPDWRASYSSHQTSYHPHHHTHDMHTYPESQIHPNPLLRVYYRKRRKQTTLDCVAPPPPPPPQSFPNKLAKRIGKVGKKKISAVSSGNREEKMCNVKETREEYKAGDMVLRQTVSRLKRNKDCPKGKGTTSKGRKKSSTRIHHIEKNKLKPKGEFVRDRTTATRKGTKFKRSGTPSKAIQKLQHKEHTAIHSILSKMKASEAVEQESEDETCYEPVEEDDEPSSRKPKRKKHRPKVQSNGPKARGVWKSFKGKVKLTKTGGENPLKKRGRPKGSKNKNRGNEGKHVSKKRKTSPSNNENFRGSRGFYVVKGCPELFNMLRCPCHGNYTQNLLPGIRDTKKPLIFAHGSNLCEHDPSDSTHVHPAAEASSSASKELSQTDGNNSQLALAPEHCPPSAVNKNGQIVIYDQRREMILFKVPKHFKKVRAKVPIGAENKRLWPLLALGGIPSEFEDPEYWEKERELMKEWVTNFILKMHEVQGDRRFSPWKGSVLDSVAGAFLTQSVLDHLSSSAFMSIASHFPPTHKEYESDASQVEIETKGESCPNDMQTSSTAHNLVHMSRIHKSSALCKEPPNTSEDHEEGIQGPYAQTDVKKVRRRLFEKDQVKNKGSKIIKQGLTQNKPSKVTAINTSTSKGTSPLRAKKTPKGKLKSMTTPRIALKILKQRRLSHISGIERAHIEENLNGRKKNNSQDWESMRKQTLNDPSRNEKRKAIHEDSVDWEAVWHSKVEDLAKAIKERGMHHVLSGRIKAFLKALKEEHGSTDLEWLRNLSPEDARAYLMSIHGLNVKSTECIRLLTLHHVAFPVDVHVGRICVRLGWVPIKPLPEHLQLHLLELYPKQGTIQKYLWPRLCTLDQKTLYEFHYQLITFGKVFCTKSKPNCHACPMRNDCKHFASAYASAKLILTGLEEEERKSSFVDPSTHPFDRSFEDLHSPNRANKDFSEVDYVIDKSFYYEEDFYVKDHFFPVNEATMHEDAGLYEEEIMDLEDLPYIYKDQRDYTEELLTSVNFSGLCTSTNEHTDCDSTKSYNLGSQSTCPPPCSYNGEGCSHCPLKEKTNSYYDHQSNHLHINETSPSQQHIIVEAETTNAIISYPMGKHEQIPQLKRVSPLRTIHYVYEIPDAHPLLEKVEPRQKDDPSPYLLVIWSPGEIPQSKKEMKKQCHSCSTSHDNQDEIVPGTLLIPCRSALKGSFPLNGTYFQVNEVFADHESSLDPFDVPRALIWQLQRRFVYFGTSVTQIFRGLTRDEIKECFSNGYICVRGFDRCNRAPKPLVCKLHFCKGREQSKKGIKVEN